MKLFATIAATSMLSQASEEIVTFNNNLNTYVQPDKIVMDTSNDTGAVVRNGDEIFCVTEEQLRKVEKLKEIQEYAIEKGVFPQCGEEALPVIDWRTHLEGLVPWTTGKKVLSFLTTEETLIGASNWDLPKPMTGPFKDMIIDDKSDDKSEKTNDKEKWKKIEVPAAIKSFFAFKVNTTPITEAAAVQAIEETNAKFKDEVAGEFGSLYLQNLGRDDEYLNQPGQNAYHFDRENKVNNPRELIKLIEGASNLNYQDLLNFAAAKLASGIRVNDLYRLRALFGFSATGDYTDETYLVQREGKIDPEEVVGYQALLRNHKWFDPNEDKNAVYFANKDKKLTVDPDYLPENFTYAKITDAAAMEKILARDYPAGWTEAWDVNKNLICKKEPANQFVEQY